MRVFERSIMLCALLASFSFVDLFTPDKIIEYMSEFFEQNMMANDPNHKVSETLTHTDILKRGLIRSITKYFIEKQEQHSNTRNVTQQVLLKKVDSHYVSDLNELYNDYFLNNQSSRTGAPAYDAISIQKCLSKLNNAIKQITNAVASVDYDKNTKDFPYAHFDAETFLKSNQYVASLFDAIYDKISKQNYLDSRKSIGQVLHAIHDFYSHSNWIEMGHERINLNIGQNTDDLGIQLAEVDVPSCFSENCTKEIIQCKYISKGLSFLIKNLKCPLVYFKCTNNVILDKLTSGYYSNQKLQDGSSVPKPMNKSKCSHGGFLDMTTHHDSIGGINKDSSFYFISPHANLHLNAANLAIEHTEYFFDMLRSKIGNPNFDKLLDLFHDYDPNC
jgi:hypothetical protein